MTLEATRALKLLSLIRSAGPRGMARDEFLRHFEVNRQAKADLANLIRSGRVLPCYRHGGTDAGPPVLVYHATR